MQRPQKEGEASSTGAEAEKNEAYGELDVRLTSRRHKYFIAVLSQTFEKDRASALLLP